MADSWTDLAASLVPLLLILALLVPVAVCAGVLLYVRIDRRRRRAADASNPR